MRNLSNGNHAKIQVDNLLELSTSNYDPRIAYENLLAKERPSGGGEVHLKRYMQLIIFNAYILESRKDNTRTCSISFSEWLSLRPDVKWILLGQDREPLPMKDSEIRENFLENEFIRKERNGSVLAHGTILKDDHFFLSVSCKESSVLNLPGAPNFRQALLNFADDFRPLKILLQSICGVAIPTNHGIKSVLDRITLEKGISIENRDIQTRIIWVCLREEPVVYLSGKPFALRLLPAININIAIPQIQTEHLEEIESRLAEECRKEALSNGHRIFIHSDSEHSQGGLRGEWFPVDIIESPRVVFEHIPTLTYFRIPISDERVPLPHTIDRLLSLLESECIAVIDGQNAKVDIVYNCQMGRGRTTTAMVITLMWYAVKEVSITRLKPSKGKVHHRVTQMLSLMPNGNDALALADHCIDLADHMQNLRECAIVEDASPEYILRYLHLIALAGYLLETASADIDSTCGPKTLFSEWLLDRCEFQNVFKAVVGDGRRPFESQQDFSLLN